MLVKSLIKNKWCFGSVDFRQNSTGKGELSVFIRKGRSNFVIRHQVSVCSVASMRADFIEFVYFILRKHLTFFLFSHVLIMLICFATDSPNANIIYSFWRFLFSIYAIRRLVSGSDLSQVPYCLMCISMLSAIPIVTPVVSYKLRILNSSLIFVMLRTVKCCIYILTLFKSGSGTMAGN